LLLQIRTLYNIIADFTFIFSTFSIKLEGIADEELIKYALSGISRNGFKKTGIIVFYFFKNIKLNCKLIVV
jgi:hypothetical protein